MNVLRNINLVDDLKKQNHENDSLKFLEYKQSYKQKQKHFQIISFNFYVFPK